MKPLYFVGTSRDDLSAFPEEVKDSTGYALYLAQLGDKHPRAKPLRGFGGAGVLEAVANDDGDTYRTVYAIRLPSAVYVLHAFQKKPTRGITTPQREIALVRERLRLAEAHHSIAFRQERGIR
ncbi:MAG: addiction module toxin RelE [Chloroflexota bacterium]|nr:MAG: addiction module toxin RelE [Chloroflexota bacterium]